MSERADKQLARAIADQLQAETKAKGGEFTDWFEELYARAAGDAELVPWGDEKPHPGLVEWMQQEPAGKSGRALDVGCGLGDNAAFLVDQGFVVTGIDLSQSAIDWAARRFVDKGITFRQADLLALPGELVGQFDFVHETYTLQALPKAMRPELFKAIASLLAPGGCLLVNTRSRAEDVVPEGPPWPLAKSELDAFGELGLHEKSIHEYEEQKEDGRQIPHLRIEYEKPC